MPEAWPALAISNVLIGHLSCIHMYMIDISQSRGILAVSNSLSLQVVDFL